MVVQWVGLLVMILEFLLECLCESWLLYFQFSCLEKQQRMASAWAPATHVRE